MKNLLLLTALILAVTSVFSQNVTLKNDMAYVDVEPYELVQEHKELLISDYELKTLDGSSFLYAKFIPAPQGQVSHFELTFLQSGQKAQLRTSLGFLKMLVKYLYRHKVIKDGALNPEGERQFVMIYPKKTSPVASAGSSGSGYNMVERNRTGMVMVIGTKIRQNQVEVGYLKQEMGFSGAKQIKTVTFYLANGTKAAEAVLEGINPDYARIHTFKDSKTRTIGINTFSPSEEIAEYLISNYYL